MIQRNGPVKIVLHVGERTLRNRLPVSILYPIWPVSWTLPFRVADGTYRAYRALLRESDTCVGHAGAMVPQEIVVLREDNAALRNCARRTLDPCRRIRYDIINSTTLNKRVAISKR